MPKFEQDSLASRSSGFRKTSGEGAGLPVHFIGIDGDSLGEIHV